MVKPRSKRCAVDVFRRRKKGLVTRTLSGGLPDCNDSSILLTGGLPDCNNNSSILFTAVTATRGILYHRDETDPAGIIRNAVIIPPTSQNQLQMERAEFLQTPTVQFLHWMRIPGDTLFALGVLAMDWFKVGLLTGHSFVKEAPEVQAGRLTAAREPAGTS